MVRYEPFCHAAWPIKSWSLRQYFSHFAHYMQATGADYFAQVSTAPAAEEIYAHLYLFRSAHMLHATLAFHIFDLHFHAIIASADITAR